MWRPTPAPSPSLRYMPMVFRKKPTNPCLMTSTINSKVSSRYEPYGSQMRLTREHIQGDDPNYIDHSRDLLRMVNHFQDRMPRPIVGMAHSMGTAQLVQLALVHPRLFHSVALIEPILIQDWYPYGPNPAVLTSHRPDLWPSRGMAEASFRKDPFFKTWHPRVLDNYLKYNLRDTPTALYPIAGSVTLTTTKHQEAWSYIRSNFSPQLGEHDPLQQLLSPDLDPKGTGTYVFSRPEVVLASNGLPHLRPSVLYLYG